MASFDGYIFITPEYNHAIGGALKNALDFLNPELNNKAAGFVGYGSLGGTRAHENLRLILGELQVADVRTAVTFSLMSDFEKHERVQTCRLPCRSTRTQCLTKFLLGAVH